MKTSKVKSVKVGGDWEKDGKVYYRHDYVMEDGQKIQANHTTENPINVGEEVEYNVTRSHEKYGDSGSVKKPNDFKKGGGYKPDTVGITVGACLNNAVSLVSAGKIESKDVEKTASFLIELSFKLKEKYKNLG